MTSGALRFCLLAVVTADTTENGVFTVHRFLQQNPFVLFILRHGVALGTRVQNFFMTAMAGGIVDFVCLMVERHGVHFAHFQFIFRGADQNLIRLIPFQAWRILHFFNGLLPLCIVAAGTLNRPRCPGLCRLVAANALLMCDKPE